MKKLYFLILTVIIGAACSYLYILGTESNQELISEDFRGVEFKTENSKKTNKPDEFTRYIKDITTKFGEEDNNYSMNYRVKELIKAKEKAKKSGAKATSAVWTQRGPANVGGRTRGLIVDPDDASNNTWFAGAATGGVWKTTDRGATWTCLTDGLPNLSVNTLAIAASNHDIIFAGTGESFPGGTYLKGSGVFKSINRGVSWTQLTATTTSDFEYVNRLVIDPANPNIVVVATEKGLMKTSDGGTIWTKVYTSSQGIEDLDADPLDFSKIYATEHGVGVIKSTNSGDSWILSSDGIGSAKRIELSISPVNTAKIYISVNTNENPEVYRSTDYGVTWIKFKDTDGTPDDYLGGQGEYDNIITAHPYDQDIAYLGGVNLWKVDFSDPGTVAETDPAVTRVDLINTDSFLSFVNFGGDYLGGGMDTGDPLEAIGLVSTDWSSVEIRFGVGMSQKAHRFTVPTTSGSGGDGGAGVATSDYQYQDYVDVPFEVWDITNNRQLMVSFRDQERDGNFNLITRNDTDPVPGREYIFVQAELYNGTTPSANIAKTAGHLYKQLYFLWPTLVDGGTWDDTSLPNSKISINYGTIQELIGSSYVVSNAYGIGSNNYDQSAGFGNTVIPGLHPDHHNLVIIKTDEANQKFIVINGNDGGLAISENEGVSFTQLPNNYITTQFYGVAKKPGANEYIGGMQDNGTWATPNGVNSSVTTDYIFHIGGDGFECVWHTGNENYILGSVYYNSIRKTTNGGNTWTSATSGIHTVTVSGENRLDGPFVTKISNNKRNPDVLFSVGFNGIYKSTNFATNWAKKHLGDGWNSTGNVANNFVTSQHNIEVSIANQDIVWAGAAMSNDNAWSIFVSTDQGQTFNTVSEFQGADLSGFISGIATHPFEDSTAYLTFSFAEETKVIRTKDLGQTWEDISGYNGNTSSSNGFPDVVTHCLVVLPHNPSTIWVGTDIGIFESVDNGVSWNYLVSDLPAVSVYDMFVQDGQVVISTHGRGIWTASIEELNYVPDLNTAYEGRLTIDADVTVVDAVDSLKIYVDDELFSVEESVSIGLNSFEIHITEAKNYKINVESYKLGIVYNSNISNITMDFSPIIDVTRVTGENSIDVSSTFVENYDSVEIFVNDNYYSTKISPFIGLYSDTVEITESGTYNCYLDAYINGTSYKSNVDAISLTYVGISNLKNSVKSLNVYPNPTTGYTNIDLPNNFNENYTIEVYSLSGSKVISKQINKSNNTINLENLNEGLYIIKLENKGEIYSQKIQLRK